MVKEALSGDQVGQRNVKRTLNLKFKFKWLWINVASFVGKTREACYYPLWTEGKGDNGV